MDRTGYTQDHRTRWTDDSWVEPDAFAQNTVQPTGRKRRTGGRSAVKRISDGTVLRRDNQWGIPRKRALFVSDGPDNMTSGSDILIYLTPDDHMMCMWQRHYVLRVDNWKKQWSGCSKTLQTRATPTWLFARLVSLVRIRPIQPMLSEMPTGPVGPQWWRQSPDRDRARINWRIYFVGY